MEKLQKKTRVEKVAYDARVLGSCEFVFKVLSLVPGEYPPRVKKEEEKWKQFDRIVERVCNSGGVDKQELFGCSRVRSVCRARAIICHAATRTMGLSGAAIAKALGISDVSALRAAAKGREIAKRGGINFE